MLFLTTLKQDREYRRLCQVWCYACGTHYPHLRNSRWARHNARPIELAQDEHGFLCLPCRDLRYPSINFDQCPKSYISYNGTFEDTGEYILELAHS